MAGSRLGVYQLVRRVGHGGMAGVYLAVRADGEFRQQVAIKLVRAGLDSDEVLSRFRNERQTPAGLSKNAFTCSAKCAKPSSMRTRNR